MEWWKEEIAKVSIGGILIFVATKVYGWAVKKDKPVSDWIKNIRNITDTRKDVQISIELIKAFMHFSVEPMWLMSIDGNLEYANPAWCDLMGFEEEEHAHFMGFMRCVPDRDQETMMKRTEQFSKHPNEFEGEVTLMHIVTKNEFKRLCVTKLINDENKKPIKSIGILKPINQ